MSSDLPELPPELEDLLQQVCVGDRDACDPEVVAARREHPEFGAELDAMLATMDTMATAASTERSALQGEPQHPAYEPKAKKFARRLELSGLAALLLTCTVIAWLAYPNGRLGEAPNGASSLELEFLGGTIGVETTTDGMFVFTCDLPPRGYFSIEITEEKPNAPIVVEVRRQTTNTWKPHAGTVDMIPAVAIMTVRAHYGSREEFASRVVRLRK